MAVEELGDCGRVSLGWGRLGSGEGRGRTLVLAKVHLADIFAGARAWFHIGGGRWRSRELCALLVRRRDEGDEGDEVVRSLGCVDECHELRRRMMKGSEKPRETGVVAFEWEIYIIGLRVLGIRFAVAV